MKGFQKRAKVIQKTKSKSQVRVERERDFLLGAPEVSVFLVCRTTVNELRCLASSFESGEMKQAVFSRQSALVIEKLNELQRRLSGLTLYSR